MHIDCNVPIPMDDGLVLYADVFRPMSDGKYPVILSYGPYAKGLAFQDGYPNQWQRMTEQHPDVAAGSTNKYQNWEVVDPEKWTRNGYVCMRVDSRGCGCSPGYIDHFSPRETEDFYQCIEWAGTQSWSNGKVGLNGISYYAINQWRVAARQPPHLAAMCVWEGAADWYRDMAHHGGILCTFWANWYDMQVKTVQYGLGRERPAEPRDGRAGLRNRNAFRGRAGGEIAVISAMKFSSIRSMRNTTRRARLYGRRSRYHFFPQEIGVVRVCIYAATLKDSCVQRQRRSGSSCTD